MANTNMAARFNIAQSYNFINLDRHRYYLFSLIYSGNSKIIVNIVSFVYSR